MKTGGREGDDGSGRSGRSGERAGSGRAGSGRAGNGRTGNGGYTRNGGRGGSGGPIGSQSLERIVGKSGRGDGKLQQRFGRLVQKVDQLKQRVRAWREARADIDTEISRYHALLEQVRRPCRELVELLDRSYSSPVFNKGDRKKLAALICELAGELIEAGGHDDLKQLYNRYSRSDFDAEAAAVDAAGAEALRSMMEMFGVEFGEADVKDRTLPVDTSTATNWRTTSIHS